MMNPYDFYITPEEYEIAARNGIRRRTLEARIRRSGWDKKRAINTPSRKKTDRSSWCRIAESNGICKATFLSRVNLYKWDEERAATEPIFVIQESNRKYSDEICRTLERNGISKQMFYGRIKIGWSLERAMTEKKYTDEERSKKGVKARKNIDNGFKRAVRRECALANAIKNNRKSSNKKKR